MDKEKLLEDYLLFHTDPEWRAAAIEIWVIISVIVAVVFAVLGWYIASALVAVNGFVMAYQRYKLEAVIEEYKKRGY